jgi:hypothetical protein
MSDKVRQIREALEFFKNPLNYVWATGMSAADKQPAVLRNGRGISTQALFALDDLVKEMPYDR